jgi:hypothetical protein
VLRWILLHLHYANYNMQGHTLCQNDHRAQNTESQPTCQGNARSTASSQLVFGGCSCQDMMGHGQGFPKQENKLSVSVI